MLYHEHTGVELTSVEYAALRGMDSGGLQAMDIQERLVPSKHQTPWGGKLEQRARVSYKGVPLTTW